MDLFARAQDGWFGCVLGRAQVWARLIKRVDFDISDEHIDLLSYQSALFFAGKELVPSRSRNVAFGSLARSSREAKLVLEAKPRHGIDVQ